MHENYPKTLRRLIENLTKLQGIGAKTAERLSFNLINQDKDFISNLSKSITDIKSEIRFSPICHCLTDLEVCGICNNPNRNQSIVCVVKDQQDVFYIEKSGYKGVYHVLDGLISPLDGIVEEDLNIENLTKRLEGVDEIILAIPFSVEGEATSFILKDILKDFDIKISRPAKGLPAGVNIEYVDQLTLQNSIEERIVIDD